MLAAGLCFTDVTFFVEMSSLSLVKGWTDRYADCCDNTADEKKLWLRIC